MPLHVITNVRISNTYFKWLNVITDVKYKQIMKKDLISMKSLQCYLHEHTVNSELHDKNGVAQNLTIFYKEK